MKTKSFLITNFLLAAFVLSACGSKTPDLPTATPVDVNAVAQQAIATFSMGLTMTAFAQPTATFTPPPTATNTQFATLTILGNAGTPVSAPTSSCNNSSYVSDVTVPDGTVMAPGQTFPKTWLVRNSGTCTWLATFKLGFGYGNPMGGQATPIGKEVKPGDQIEVTVNLIAPAAAGDASGVWRLMDDKGAFFGTNLSVVIKVVGAAAKSPTPTETPSTP